MPDIPAFMVSRLLRWVLVPEAAQSAGVVAKLPFQVHPHMLRHACGFKLANDGVDTRALQHYFGHKNIQHTVRYTELRSDRFNGFWKAPRLGLLKGAQL